jgi:hypothetical protein
MRPRGRVDRRSAQAARTWTIAKAGHRVKAVSVTHGAEVESHQPARVRASRGLWLWVALGALVGGVVGGVIANAFWSGPDVASAACTASVVADQVVPSVVTIEVGRSSAGAPSTGSGEFYQEGGYILQWSHMPRAEPAWRSC